MNLRLSLFLLGALLQPLASASPIERSEKSLPYYDYPNLEDYNYDGDGGDYMAMAIDDNALSRAAPSRKRPTNYNSPIYYIRLPPQPYMFVPGLGYISQPAPPPVPQFLNLPVSFVANGKPSTIYQWNGGMDQFPGAPPPPRPQKPQKPDSVIQRLPGQYNFNGKPDDIFVLRDSYNSLYGDALQNFYP